MESEIDLNDLIGQIDKILATKEGKEIEGILDDLEINTILKEKIDDIIDYRFLAADEEIVLQVEKSNGEVWDIEKDLFILLSLCKDLLSDEPLFVLVNSYSGLSPVLLENLLKLTINANKLGKISVGEIGLPIKQNDLILPCGIYGRVDYE